MGIFQQTLQQKQGGGSPESDPFKAALNSKMSAPPKPDLQTKLDTSKNYGDNVGGEMLAGGKKIAGSISSGAANIQKAGQETGVKSAEDAALGTAQAAFGTITGAAQIAFSPVTPAISKIVKWITPALRKLNPQLAAAYDYIAPKVDKVAQKHPQVAGVIGDAFNTALLAIGGGAAEEDVTKAFTDALSKDGLPKDVVNTAKDIKENGLLGIKKPEVDTITEKIQPKATAKETKLAETQGRLVKGKEPTLFKSGTADTVLPSEKVTQAAQTIKDQIPGAAKMDEPTLYKALDDKTGEIATNLKPEMKKAPIKPETLKKINDDWSELKKKQISSADASEEANVRKNQLQFEERLKKTNTESLDDIWQTRKEYDASVPDNVKNANSLSSESLQNKRTIWLQNRSILNNAINDAESGLGETSRKAFSDMNDMYTAKEGLLSKAKVEGPKPSKLRQFSDSPKGKVLKGALKLGGGALLIDKAGKALGL